MITLRLRSFLRAACPVGASCACIHSDSFASPASASSAAVRRCIGLPACLLLALRGRLLRGFAAPPSCVAISTSRASVLRVTQVAPDGPLPFSEANISRSCSRLRARRHGRRHLLDFLLDVLVGRLRCARLRRPARAPANALGARRRSAGTRARIWSSVRPSGGEVAARGPPVSRTWPNWSWKMRSISAVEHHRRKLDRRLLDSCARICVVVAVVDAAPLPPARCRRGCARGARPSTRSRRRAPSRTRRRAPAASPLSSP